MATRFDKFTVKAQEALQGTQDVAGRFARGGWRSEERADNLRAGRGESRAQVIAAPATRHGFSSHYP